MWDIVVLKKVDGLYLVMAPNGDTQMINEETLQIFINQNRVKL